MKTIAHPRSFSLFFLPLFLFMTHCTAITPASDAVSQSPPPQPTTQTDSPPLSPQEELERFSITLDRA